MHYPPPPPAPCLVSPTDLPPGPEIVPAPIDRAIIANAAVFNQLPPPLVIKKRIDVRKKGQRGEREVVDLLQDVVDGVREALKLQPIVLQRNALQAHLGGEDIHGLTGYAVEVKFQENSNVPAWWRQCLDQAARVNGVPILFYRAKQQKWTVKFRAYVQTPKDTELLELDVTTNLEDFLTWFEKAYTETAVDEWERLK